MKKAFPFLFVFLVAACASNKNYLDKEEERQAKLEMQTVMQMLSSKEIPPIEFEFNSDKLKESSRPLLDKIASILLNHPTVKLVVIGHTDDVGDEEYNKWLSLKRAEAVKDYLTSLGVYPPYIRVYGYGESRPLVRDTSEKARALNRRVEFILTTREWGTVY